MDEDIFKRYEDLTKRDAWAEALPLIEQILQAGPEVFTSWFNYGVCLDELERHLEAAQAFQKALSIEFSDAGARFRMLRSLLLAKQLGVLYDESRVLLDYDPQFLIELTETDTFNELYARQRQFSDLAEACKRRVELQAQPQNIPVGTPGGIRAEHAQALAKKGFHVPETVPARWRQSPSLRETEEIAQRTRALFFVFWFLSEVGEATPAELLRARLESEGLREHLVAEEAYMFRLDRVQAVQQFGQNAGWYLERLLPLAWILGFDLELTVDGQHVDGDDADALIEFLGNPIEVSFKEWSERIALRDEESVKEIEDLAFAAHSSVEQAEGDLDKLPEWFDPVFNGGVVVERWGSLFWALSPGLTADPGLW